MDEKDFEEFLERKITERQNELFEASKKKKSFWENFSKKKSKSVNTKTQVDHKNVIKQTNSTSQKSQEVRWLQQKFENSEFCDLLVKFILKHYSLTTFNSEDDGRRKARTITLYEDYIYLDFGGALHFVNQGYQDLKSDQLLDCAYAIGSKLKQHEGNNVITTYYHSPCGYGDSARVTIQAFKVAPLKKVY